MKLFFKSLVLYIDKPLSFYDSGLSFFPVQIHTWAVFSDFLMRERIFFEATSRRSHWRPRAKKNLSTNLFCLPRKTCASSYPHIDALHSYTKINFSSPKTEHLHISETS